MSAREIEKLQITIRQVVRRKMKGRARNLPNDIIHGHKDLGGLGIDKLVDVINAARLKMLERFLHNHNMSHDIILGAIHRLRKYAKTNTNPMETKICDYVEPCETMWLYHLKQWMEEHDIELRGGPQHETVPMDAAGAIMITKTKDRAIIDDIYSKRNKPVVWKWLRKNNIHNVSDLLDAENKIQWRDAHALDGNVYADLTQTVNA